MPVEPMGALRFEQAAARPDLLAPVVTAVVRAWRRSAAEGFAVAPIDPQAAEPEAFCALYGIDPADYADCLVVQVRRGGSAHLAACVVPADRRIDLDGVVRPYFGAYGVSAAPLDVVSVEAGMEPGGVTPIGLPGAWPLLVDPRLTEREWILAGSGVRRSKLAMPGTVLAELPASTLLAGLAQSKDG